MTSPLAATTAPLPSASLIRRLGPGLITGAADDDPCGIATYSQVGAQFGYGLTWTMLFSLPFMIIIQEISGRIGCVTGHGIPDILRHHYHYGLVHAIVVLLLVANAINLGAAPRLLPAGGTQLYTIGVGILCIVAEVLHRVRFRGHVPWDQALLATLVPHLGLNHTEAKALSAVLGTTISPWLFFWQASLKVEDGKRQGVRPPCLTLWLAKAQFARIRADTLVGMGMSNAIGICIIFATAAAAAAAAATLHAAGIFNIETPSQAAEALRPIGGKLTFVIFAAGIAIPLSQVLTTNRSLVRVSSTLAAPWSAWRAGPSACLLTCATQSVPPDW